MRKIRTPYLLLLPGFAFLFTFFILPIINLAQTSTQTSVVGRYRSIRADASIRKLH